VTTVMDVAYLDVPYVAHVTRNAVLLRMNPACWEDACHDCPGVRCVCACHDGPAGPVTRRCRKCRYLVTATGHLITCDPAALDARVRALADSIGVAA
jgi:hypothetical protein